MPRIFIALQGYGLQMALAAAGQVVATVSRAAELEQEASDLVESVERAMTYVLVGIRQVNDPRVRDNLVRLWDNAHKPGTARDKAQTMETLTRTLRQAHSAAKSTSPEFSGY